jgi:hypothetical protein
LTTFAFSTAAGAAPLIAPIAGAVNSASHVLTQVTGVYDPDYDLHQDKNDAWLTAPESLSALSGISYVSDAGNLFAMSEKVDADWTSALAGSINIESQGLLIDQGEEVRGMYAGQVGTNQPPAWTYRFTAQTDALITMDVTSLFQTGGGGASNYYFDNLSGHLQINGIPMNTIENGHVTQFGADYRGFSAEPSDSITATYDLEAGTEYFIELFQRLDVSSLREGLTPISGTAIVNASQHITFAITDRPVDDPNGPSTPLPEPTTWALMVAGFGLAGAALRRGGESRRLSFS